MMLQGISYLSTVMRFLLNCTRRRSGSSQQIIAFAFPGLAQSFYRRNIHVVRAKDGHRRHGISTSSSS